jgi:hypothetical protein
LLIPTILLGLIGCLPPAESDLLGDSDRINDGDEWETPSNSETFILEASNISSQLNEFSGGQYGDLSAALDNEILTLTQSIETAHDTTAFPPVHSPDFSNITIAMEDDVILIHYGIVDDLGAEGVHTFDISYEVDVSDLEVGTYSVQPQQYTSTTWPPTESSVTTGNVGRPKDLTIEE